MRQTKIKSLHSVHLLYSPSLSSVLILCTFILVPLISVTYSFLSALHGCSCQFMSPCLLLIYRLKCDQVSFMLAAEACRGVGKGGGPPSFPGCELRLWVQLLSELFALEIQLFWNCLKLKIYPGPCLLPTARCGNRLCFNVLLTDSSKQVSQLA